MADQDITKMKVVDLKLELKKRGLSTTGNKNELQDRLQAALNGCGDILEDSTAISDDLLDDELIDDDLDDKDLLEHDQEDELLSPSPESEKKKIEIKSQQFSTGVNATSTTDQAPVHKKISLKRNLSIQAPVLPQTSKPVESSPAIITVSSDSEENPAAKKMKLTELSAEERLKLRAQKFGASAVTVSKSDSNGDERKLARAARFGISSTNSNSSASIKDSAPEASLDVLKKRAERFGAAIAPKLSVVENEEKRKKRQERFGDVSSTNSDMDKAKLARLERFKSAA